MKMHTSVPIKLLLAMIISSCVPAPKEETVVVKTEGIFVQESFTVVGGSDLGEVLTGSDPVLVTLVLKNNSKFNLIDINLMLDQSDASSMGMTFALTDEGRDEFPGKGGDCKRILEPGKACSMVISYNPNRSGVFKQLFSLSYKNYIEKVVRNGEIKVLTGEPASLVYVDGGATNYDYGILEQTEPEVRYERMKIENRGGLSARNVQVTLNSTDAEKAFSLVEHNCPQVIKAGTGCEALVSYVPLNILETDAETNYQSNLNFNYIKDGKISVANLNSYYRFKSTKIQGNFDTNLALIEFTPSIVVGNKDTQSFRITNKGYREAILKKLTLKDAGGVAKAECVKATSGTELACFLPATSTPVTLAQSPFKIVDLDACAERDAYGSITGTAGEACDFSITFWPSVTYTTNQSFIGWKIDVTFDSRWKGNETIITKETFSLTADSVAAAEMAFETFNFGSGVFPVDSDPSKAMSFFDVGRVALISSAAYYTNTSIRLKNYGPTPGKVVSIKDGQATPQNITVVPTTIASVSDPGFSSSWQLMSHNCDIVDPNLFCNMSGRFIPLFYSNEARQDRLFFDVEPNSPTQGPNRYKRFIARYKDGTTYEDDGSLRADREVEFRVTGLLITKGFLVFQDLLGGNVGQVVAGDERNHKVLIQNVGTGRIPYIKLSDTDRLYHLDIPGAPPLEYDMTLIADPPPVGVTKDCYGIVDYDNTYLDSPNPPKGFLDPGESCAMTVNIKRKNYDTFTLWNPPDPPYLRCHDMTVDGTYDQWELEGDMVWGNHNINFAYYDGDGGLGLPLPYLDTYGFFFNLPSSYPINVNWRSLGCFMIREPASLFSSAVVYRPAINLPPIAGAPAAWTWQFGGNVIPEVYLTTTALAGGDVSKQSLAINHAQTYEASDVSYVYHMGTFPANGQTFTGVLTLAGRNSTNPRVDSWSFTPAIAQITLTSPFPATPFNVNGGTLSFNFSANTPGVYQRTLQMNYFNGFVNKVFSVRVIAEATNTYPTINVSSQEYSVVMVAGTPVETLNGPIQNPINALWMSYDLGFNDTYFAVKGSAVYAKKQYTITNNSALPITKLSVFWQGVLNAQSYSNTPTGNGFELIDASNCLAVALAPAASCTFAVKWKPPTVSAAVAGFLTVQYDIAPDQYLTKSWRVQLNAGDPASLSVWSASTVQVNDANDSNLTRSSYPVDWGAITAPGHIQTVSYPHSVSKTGYWVRNSSALKASFLKMFPGHVVPGGNPVLMYNSGQKKVYVTRACIYGDDEFAAIPIEEKGFNAATVANCTMNIQYDANESYVGKDIDINYNVMKLEFYNNKHSSTDFIWFHIKGFVEPNFSSSVGGYSNVTALNTGVVTIGWNAFTPQNASWGAITNYTIFYSQTESSLNNVHTTAAAKVDVSATTYSHTFPGLQVGRYYYFKVVAKRNKNGVNYYSENKPIGTVKVVVPPAGSIYSHSLAALIDRAYQPGFGIKSVALSTCASKVYNLINGGLASNINKALINTNVWNFLRTDPDTSSYSTYSDYPIPAVSHWLSDAATDIAPIFTPYGFDTTATTQYVPGPELLYQKTCSDNSCNLLDKIVGGDGSELPFNATLYIKGTAGGGVFRCYAPI